MNWASDEDRELAAKAAKHWMGPLRIAITAGARALGCDIEETAIDTPSGGRAPGLVCSTGHTDCEINLRAAAQQLCLVQRLRCDRNELRRFDRRLEDAGFAERKLAGVARAYVAIVKGALEIEDDPDQARLGGEVARAVGRATGGRVELSEGEVGETGVSHPGGPSVADGGERGDGGTTDGFPTDNYSQSPRRRTSTPESGHSERVSGARSSDAGVCGRFHEKGNRRSSEARP